MIEETTINCLKLRTTSGSYPDVCPSAIRPLKRSDLRPDGMPASAILIIRSMGAQLPHHLIFSRDDFALDTAWQKATRDSLADLYCHAARPAYEAVPANAAAVLFAGEAEMLACLACDWQAGELVNRWWWRAIYRGSFRERVVVREWLKHAVSIPGALEHLSRRGEIRRFATTLNEDDVSQLLRETVVRFALDYLRPVFDSSTHLPTLTDVLPEAFRAVTKDNETIDARLNSATPPLKQEIPWTKWIPEIDIEDLELGRRALVAVGLMLYRAPTVVRSPAFARDVAGWFRSEQMSEGSRSTRLLSKSGIPHGEAMSVPSRESSENLTRQTHTKTKPRRAAGKLPTEPEEESDFDTLPAECRHTGLASSSSDRHSPTIPGVEVESLLSFVRVRDRVSAPIVSERRVETELGGLFYLINVAISLELYRDFTSPLEPGLSMSVWDFIELVGRRMLRGRFKHDPVWKLLGHLACRTGRESPGMYFEPPHEWRIPCEWLKPFGNRSVWTWAVDDGSLRVRHGEGFYVLDISGRGNLEELLHRELAAYNASTNFMLRRGLLRPAAVLPLERWLDWIVPFILARLKSAFGVNRNAAGLLLKHRADIVVGDERIDINLFLAELPIAIRLSGLDRDPGWVPAAGRYVSFHYS